MTATTDIERAVLGCVILDTEIQHRAKTILRPQLFQDEFCKKIFDLIRFLWGQNKHVDLLNLSLLCRKRSPELDIAKISELTSHVATGDIVTFDRNCLILEQEWIRKQAVRICQDMLVFADGTEDPLEFTDQTISRLSALLDVKWAQSNVLNNVQIVEGIRKGYQQKEDNASKNIPAGVPSGIRKFDQQYGGYHPGELYIEAGRPGMGKSRKIIQSIMAAADAGYAPLFVSAEMPEENVRELILVQQSNEAVSPDRLRNGTLYFEEKLRKERVELELLKKKFYVTEERDLNKLCAIVRKHVRENDVKILFIDFIQRLSAKAQNREAEVSLIARELKSLAKDCKIPVVCIASLSRAVEARGGDKRPILSDLRDSGNIESEADFVGFWWRPAYYEFEVSPGQRYTNEIFFLPAKARFGKLEDIELRHDKYLSNFYDPENAERTYEEKVSGMKANADFERSPNEPDQPF